MNDIKHDLQEQRRVRRLRDRNIKWGRELRVGKLPELQRACAAASVPCAILINDRLPYKANKRSLSTSIGMALALKRVSGLLTKILILWRAC